MKVEVTCGFCYVVNEVDLTKEKPICCQCGTPISNWRIATKMQSQEKRP